MTRPARFDTNAAGAVNDRPITVDGVSLHKLAYNIRTLSGLSTTSGLRGSNPSPGGRDGSLWVPKKSEPLFGQIDMWASPIIDGQAAPTTVEAAKDNWRKNQDILNAMFDTRYRQIVIKMQTGPNAADYRECLADVTKAIDPEVVYGVFGRFVVEFEVTSAFWRDMNSSTWNSPTGAGAVATHTVSTMLGSTAPNNELVYTVTGPLTNPRLTDVATGHYVTFNGALTAGQQWVVDAAAWTSKVAGTTVATNTVSSGVYNPRLMVLSASVASGPQVTLGGTGAAAGTALSIVGKRFFR